MVISGSTEASSHAALFNGLDVVIPGAERVAEIVADELPQKDDLCGPLWTWAGLRALGETPATPEDVAASAGTLLWEDEAGGRPPGQPPRRDYSRILPSTADPGKAGTDVEGLVRATDLISSGRVKTLVFGPGARGWSPEDLARVLDGRADARRPSEVRGRVVPVILNVATEQYVFTSTRSGGSDTDAVLTGAPDRYRASTWRVGHFVALLGWRDTDAGRFYRLHDSYALDGANFVHDQPEEALARALSRPGRTPGSVLVLARGDTIDAI